MPTPRQRKIPREQPTLPHSWSFADWPRSVFPGDTSRARYLYRMLARELLQEGAVARGEHLAFNRASPARPSGRRLPAGGVLHGRGAD